MLPPSTVSLETEVHRDAISQISKAQQLVPWTMDFLEAFQRFFLFFLFLGGSQSYFYLQC